MPDAHTFSPAELRIQDAAEKLADALAPELAGRSVLHFGAESLFLAAALVRRGVDANVLPARTATSAVTQALGLSGRVLDTDVTSPISDRFDVVLCFGGLDSLESASLAQAVRNIASATDVVALKNAAANVPMHLREHGLSRDFGAATASLPSGSALFRRELVPDTELVRGYEQSLIEQHTTLARARGESEESLRAQVVKLREELLIARDAAVGAEAKAGEAKARHAELLLHVAAMENERNTMQAKIAQTLDRAIPEKGWELLGKAKRSVRGQD